jgi:hypothetical protein
MSLQNERKLRGGVPFGTALLVTLALASCQIPLVLQDPMALSGGSAWNSQGRFSAPRKDASAVYDEGLEDRAQGPPLSMGALAGEEDDWGAGTWGEGVVESPQPGAVAKQGGAMTRGLEPSVEGRMHIIELYQEVLDERDQLGEEVGALHAALATTEQRFELERVELTADRTRLAELEEEHRRVLAENSELLSRLTTAQVRRLEAEKLLLETQIAWHRERIGTPAASEPVSLGPREGGRE